MQAVDLEPFAKVPVEVEVLLERGAIRARELAALCEGSLLRLRRRPGEDLELYAGGAPLGSGQAIERRGSAAVRVTGIGAGEP